MSRAVSEFTPDEQHTLAPYFSNLTGPVFALTNLPETVKGALFARYSRSAKSLRRLFLDEFAGDVAGAAPAGESRVGVERAEKLYARVFSEYGDDSVAQLGGVHLACEGVSNILTKVIEWGRLMAYLEQSTRYVPYTDRPGGRWKYHVPRELAGTPLLARYTAAVGSRRSKSTRAGTSRCRSIFVRGSRRILATAMPSIAPRSARKRSIPCGACCRRPFSRTWACSAPGRPTRRCCSVCARTRSSEARDYADQILTELRKVIPAFLTRVDQPDRGGRWSHYFADTRQDDRGRGGEAAVRGGRMGCSPKWC